MVKRFSGILSICFESNKIFKKLYHLKFFCRFTHLTIFTNSEFIHFFHFTIDYNQLTIWEMIESVFLQPGNTNFTICKTAINFMKFQKQLSRKFQKFHKVTQSLKICQKTRPQFGHNPYLKFEINQALEISREIS